MEKLGRNSLCWCGSGKKYKSCHGPIEDKIEQLRYIPYSAQANGGVPVEFIMGAGEVEVGNVKVPVFEAKAPYKTFLLDLEEQLLINLIDEQKNVLYNYPGVKVGDLNQATNDAGNWE